MAARVALAWILVIVITLSVSATDHIVGANRGWNIGVNYTDWVNNQTFVLDDLISFRYEKDQYNVLRVNESSYDNCTMDNPIGNWSSDKDFIELNETKSYWFIDGKGGCSSGMKITFKVNKTAPALHPSPANASSDSKSSDASHCLLRPAITFFSALSMFLGALSTI